jgi:hypothetical protein
MSTVNLAEQQHVATFSLPSDEGEARLFVHRTVTSSWLSHPLSGSYWLFHKPYCGGPMRPVRVGEHKMFLVCGGCNARIPLLVATLPQTLSDLNRALEETCRSSSLPELAKS